MSRLHRMLLILLPPGRRRRDGPEIARTFAEQRAGASTREQPSLWWREALGLIRFGARERWAHFTSPDTGGDMTIFSNWKWLIAGTTLAGAAAGFIVARATPPQYRSEALVALVASKVPSGFAPQPWDSVSADQRVEAIQREVFSRSHLERIIQDLDLYHAERASRLMQELVDRLRTSVSIVVGPSSDGRGSWFRISHVGSDPRTVMRVTDRMASLFIEESTRSRRLQIEGTDAFLQSRITDVRRRLVDKEKAMLAEGAGNRAETEVLVIERDALRLQYKALLATREDALTAETLEQRELGEQFRLLDAAQMPQRPIAPSRLVMTALGAAAGSSLGLVLAASLWLRRRSGLAATPQEV